VKADFYDFGSEQNGCLSDFRRFHMPEDPAYGGFIAAGMSSDQNEFILTIIPVIINPIQSAQ
jgi:hypothetical protein